MNTSDSRKKDIKEIWCEENAKLIPSGTFERETGINFYDYSEENKKSITLFWNIWHRKRVNSRKTKTKKKGACICEDQLNQEPNAYYVVSKEPIRRWTCPQHGNRFARLNELTI